MKATCSVPGCDRPVRRITYCNSHLKRFERVGDVQADKPIRHAPKAPERDDITVRILAQSTTVDTGCIIWTGLLDAAGYGRIGWHGRMWQAHRAIWTHSVGPIPMGNAPDGSDWTLDHLCYQRPCVNVEHLEVVSRIENARRAGGLPKAQAAYRVMVAERGDPPHGNLRRYRRLGCRCDLCRAVNTAATRARRAALKGAK